MVNFWEQENARLRQRVAELERASTIWERTAKQMEANYESYQALYHRCREALARLPLVGGLVWVAEEETGWTVAYGDDASQTLFCCGLANQAHAEAIAALLRLRQREESCVANDWRKP